MTEMIKMICKICACLRSVTISVLALAHFIDTHYTVINGCYLAQSFSEPSGLLLGPGPEAGAFDPYIVSSGELVIPDGCFTKGIRDIAFFL